MEYEFSPIFEFAAKEDVEFGLIRKLAKDIHGRVCQTYDGKPYGYHLDMVVDMLLRHADIPFDVERLGNHAIVTGIPRLKLLVTAAYLHDAIEDARLTYHDILDLVKDIVPGKTESDVFSTDAEYVAELVYALTADKGRNRAEREGENYWKGIRDVNGASLLKMCDRLANMTYSYLHGSTMARKYADEMVHYLEFMCISELPYTMQIRMDELIEKIYDSCKKTVAE